MNTPTAIKRKRKASVGLKGVYTIKQAFLETPEQFAIDRQIKALHDKASEVEKQGKYTEYQAIMAEAQRLIEKLNRICKVKVHVYENLIPTVGRAAIANWLTQASPSPASIKLNYTALGTGVTTPANGDTQLQTETYRKVISSTTNVDNIAYCTAFYTAIETSGTFTEAGVFMNATGTANSGTLFSRVAISVVKTVATTLTIDYTVTLT